MDTAEAFVSTNAMSRDVNRCVKAGTLRKIASRLYTWNLDDAPESIVLRNLWDIVNGYFPGALIADRTALELMPAADGSVCLITESGRDIDLPGITLRPRRGLPPMTDDRPFLTGLYLCSTARAYLENMRPSRSRNGHLARTLSTGAIESKLDALIRQSGPSAAASLLDDIRTIAPALDLKREAEDLATMFESLSASHRQTSGRHDRPRLLPHDPERVAQFESLHRALSQFCPTSRPAALPDREAKQTLSFYETYFSNFIEGTEFAVDEAADILFKGRMPVGRSADAHDICGTWATIHDPAWATRIPDDCDDFLDILQKRNAIIMSGRAENRPGQFKQLGNRAGSTLFVAPELVTGTLERGFPLYQNLPHPFQRAAYIHFLVVMVHPFDDGNGRTSRVMMNAELEAAGEMRIVIPTVYRYTYLSALESLSRQSDPAPFISMLDYAQAWSAAIPWRSMPDTQSLLESCHAFANPKAPGYDGETLIMPPVAPIDELSGTSVDPHP